jgi:type II secretory pathway pseudopilin PulG
MTMIETMVAMAISAVLVLGAITVYNNARANYRTAENLARLQESMRFATDTIDQDIRLAGFWGRTNESASMILDPALQVMCGTADVTDWALGSGNRGTGIDADDDNYALPCPGVSPRANSDVLVVRRVSTDQGPLGLGVDPNPGQVQVLSQSVGGHIFADGILPVAPDPDRNQLHDVVINAYYVSNQSKYSNTLPSLRRRSLVGSTMQDQEIIAGVENLQVQFGVDRNFDGQVDGYVDDDNVTKRDDNIVAVRLWLLIRGDADETGQGYVDNNSYATPDADGFVITPSVGNDYPQNYRRFAITRTVILKNAWRAPGP